MGGYLCCCAAFLTCGIVLADALCAAGVRTDPALAGAGASGWSLMMWSPTVFAFSMKFTAAAQLAGAGRVGAAGRGGMRGGRGAFPAAGGLFCGEMPPALVLCAGWRR